MNKKEKIEQEFQKVVAAYQEIADSIIDNVEVFAGSDYSCYPTTREIEIPYLISENEANAFLISVNKASVGNIDVNNFEIYIWSILHEIGHLSSKQGDVISRVGRKISQLLCKCRLLKFANKIYFNLPEEKNATELATDYVNLHYQEVKQLEQKLQDAYYNFYNSLGIKI